VQPSAEGEQVTRGADLPDATAAPSPEVGGAGKSVNRRAINVTGIVQGVGFRPLVHGLAREFATASAVGVAIDERAIPIRREVASACEVLGLDPLYVASEGKLVGGCTR